MSTRSAPTQAAGGVDASRCPICAGPNGCALQQQRRSGQPQPPCWCTRATFTAELLARVPPQARGRACIGARCACVEPPPG